MNYSLVIKPFDVWGFDYMEHFPSSNGYKYRGSIVVLLISKSVEPNEEQKEIPSGVQQGNLCKHSNYW